MNSWKIILATVVIFAAGVFTGGLLVNYIDHSHRPRRPAESTQRPQENRERAETPMPPEPPLARQMNKDLLKRLDEKLQLTPDQHSKIERIIADGQERNHELWTNVAPRMRAVMLDVNRQIKEQLTSEQQKDFEELLKQFHPPRRQSTNSPSTGASTNILSRAATNSSTAETNAVH